MKKSEILRETKKTIQGDTDTRCPFCTDSSERKLT